MYDLVIRGGTVVDGLGHDPISTDVAVKDGRIAKIGAIPADAAEVVDAGGLALMPGIIDLHTHYDAQVTWDPTLSPSPSLGVTTAVMGEEASIRKEPTAAELAEMKRLVAEALDQGAIGLGASYSLNHSGWDGVPMPSTISDMSEFDALVGAMGGPGRGVVEISSGPSSVATMEEIAARHGRRIFMSTALALYNEQYPERAIGMFDACAAAQARGNELYIQITCQPLSFDFTLASAYPFYAHPAFDPIKAYDREQLKAVFADASFRERFRTDLKTPLPGTVFQGNWQ